MTDETKPEFVGTWNHIRNENFEEFLSVNGANWIARKMAGRSSPTLEITRDGEKFCIKLVSMFMTRETSFTIGEMFEETQHSGAVMQVTPSWQDNKLVLDYNPKEADAAKSQKHTREIVGDELILTMVIGDTTAKRIFKRHTIG